MSPAEGSGPREIRWRIEREIDGRLHRLSAIAFIPDGVNATYVACDGSDKSFDEGDILFLDQSLRPATAEMGEWLRLAQTDPWDGARAAGDWGVTRRIGSERFTLRIDLTRRGVPVLTYERAGRQSITLGMEEALFLRQALAAISAEQEALMAMGAAAAGYGEPPASLAHRAGQPWSDDDRSVAMRLWEQGVDVTSIARHLGRSEIATASQLQKLGAADRDAIMFTSRSHPPLWREERNDETASPA